MRTRWVAAIGLGVALSAWPRAAAANGRFPASNQLAVGPVDARLLVLRTTFGLLVSRDGGGAWDWVCEQATVDGGFGAGEDPAVGVTASGAIVQGAFEGLFASADDGCTWSRAAAVGPGGDVVDDVVLPSDGDGVLALVNAYSGHDDAGQSTFASQVYASSDDGASWTAVGPALDPSLVLETIDVAASDPDRMYVSGARGEGDSRQALLLASGDGGATWRESAISPFDPTRETGPFIVGVDPASADRVYVRTAPVDGASSRLLVIDDAGQTWRVAYNAKGPLLGAAIANGGQTLYVGGPADGLLAADRDALAFSTTSVARCPVPRRRPAPSARPSGRRSQASSERTQGQRPRC